MTYPTMRPELTLDFANSRQLDPRITFSRSSGATYLNPDTGLITLASEHEARFEKEGLLIEQSRTNTILHSADLTASSWNEPQSSSWSAGDIAPDGVTTSDRLTEDSSASNEEHGVSVAVANLSGGDDPGIDITVSFWAKSSNRGIRARALAWADWTFYFDIANVSGNRDAQIASGNLIPFPNGWYKCVYTGNVQGDRRFSLQTFVAAISAPGDANYSGDGSSYVDLFGVQTEAGSFQTSYIPTAGSTVTRDADITQITGDNFSSWYGGLTGTYTVEAWNKTGSNQYSMTCDNGTNGTRILFAIRANYQLQIRIGNSTSVQLDAQPGEGQQPQGMTKYAGSYSPDGASIAYGGVSNTDSSAVIPQCIRLNIGQFTGKTYNITIARISYYNQRLTDAELQSITL
jgi:hypothetical protein